MAKQHNRTPFGYNGSRITTHALQDLLPAVVDTLQTKVQGKPEEILQAWPRVAGTVSYMTRAVRFDFDRGVLLVLVKNSTLLSLLANPRDKQKLVDALQRLVPQVVIRDILFRIG